MKCFVGLPKGLQNTQELLGGNSCPSTQARRKSAEWRWLGWLLWAHQGWATLPSTKSHPARLDTPSFLQLCRHHHHQTAPQRDNSRSCCCDKPSQRGVTRGFHLGRNHGGRHGGLGCWALSPAQAPFLSQAVSWGKHLCFVSAVIPNNCIRLATGFHREVPPPKSTPCFSGKHIASDAQPHCLDQVILLLTPGKQSACPPFKVHHSNFKLIRSRGKKACLQDSFKPRLAPAILFSPALPKFFPSSAESLKEHNHNSKSCSIQRQMLSRTKATHTYKFKNQTRKIIFQVSFCNIKSKRSHFSCFLSYFLG